LLLLLLSVVGIFNLASRIVSLLMAAAQLVGCPTAVAPSFSCFILLLLLQQLPDID